MVRTHRKISLVAAVVSVLAITLTQSPIAAAASARMQQTLSVVSGNVRVFATTTQSFVPTGIALSTSIANGTAKTFFINNSGDLTVSRFTMTITLPNNSNISSFKRCAVNVSFTATNTCATGSPITLTNPVSDSATVYILSTPGPGYYSFQIIQNKTGSLVVATSASLANVASGVSNS
jgi:hypothetical protein